MHDQRGVTCNDILGPASFLSRLMRPLPLKNWNKTKIQRWLKKVLLIALYAQFLLHAQNCSINPCPEWFWFILVGQWGEPGMTLGSWAALLSLLPPRKSLKVLIKKSQLPFYRSVLWLTTSSMQEKPGMATATDVVLLFLWLVSFFPLLLKGIWELFCFVRLSYFWKCKHYTFCKQFLITENQVQRRCQAGIHPTWLFNMFIPLRDVKAWRKDKHCCILISSYFIATKQFLFTGVCAVSYSTAIFRQVKPEYEFWNLVFELISNLLDFSAGAVFRSSIKFLSSSAHQVKCRL